MTTLTVMLKELALLKKSKEKADAAAVKAAKAYEEKRTEVLGRLNEEHLDTARSGKVSVSVYSRDVAEVEDWDKFYGWMFRNKAYDALQRRAAVRALLERRENARGKSIPGVKFDKVRTLRVTVDK